MTRRELEEHQEKRRRRNRGIRNFLLLLVPVVVVGVILSVTRSNDGGSNDASSKKKPEATTTTQALPQKPTFAAAPPLTIDPAKTYVATITTSEGPIVVALDAKSAPTSVNNFVFLARQGFYDGLPFHRVSKGLVIQGGDPKGDGSGGPGYDVATEAPTGAYTIGSVAWAKTGTDPAGTAGSQFFIGTGPGITSLPQDYGIIGQVTEGLDVAQKIESFAPASGDGAPTKPVLIEKVTIAES